MIACIRAKHMGEFAWFADPFPRRADVNNDIAPVLDEDKMALEMNSVVGRSNCDRMREG